MAGYTPMIQQYLKIKAEYQDAFLFFRLGDFYEMFFDDALKASQELEITLTGREGGGEERIPMCGVPYHSAANYIDTLVDKGYVPVVSPIALSKEFDFLNVDGDRAAAYIAGEVKADKVIFITNVNGLILNDKLITNMTFEQATVALPKIGFGMEKKVMACTEAIEMGVKEAIIASGQVENPISAAIIHNNCTVITAN